MIVLHWIHGYARDWKTFVSNRVQEIQESFEPECWRHCPGNENPADVASRGCSLEGLDERWWSGPDFLVQPRCCWPDTPQSTVIDDSKLERNKNKTDEKISSNVAQVQAREPLFDVSRYEKWSKMLTVTARVMKCLSTWKRKVLEKDEPPHDSSITSTDIKNAELYWLKEVQRECYDKEINDLKQQRKVNNKSSLLPLNPILDEEDGLLKVGGRLKNADLPEEQRQPIILPKKIELVHKIIQSQHEKKLHAGIEHVLACTRERYWIVHGRREVSKVINKCKICKRWKAPATEQKTGQLPRERVVPDPCFANVGMDFAGPFYLKEGKTKVKSYVCVFSCMSSRAVHLELVMSMDTERVLMALRRLFARRGLCKTIWSDNFKSFKSANRQLQALWKKVDEKQVLHELANQQIEWKFIPERAPHMGGFYERIVKSLKTPLKKVLGKALVNAEEFVTILTEVEGQINSRPLTRVSSDPDDLNVITPAHLMFGRALQSLPKPPTEADVNIAKKWRQRQRLTTHFWNRWRKEYLTELNRYKKWMKVKPNLQVGDVVLISEERVPRTEWPLGRVIKTYAGKDGLVRVVQLKTAKGELKRPIHKLHLLEGNIQ